MVMGSLSSTNINTVTPYGYVSNPFIGSNYSIYDDAFTNTSIFPNTVTPSLSFNYSDYAAVLSTISMFDLYMNNQMPIYRQNDFFSKSYNTKTNLTSLKDVYNPELSSKLAGIAERNAKFTNTTGWCAKEINDSIQLAGLAHGETRVSSAYQEADVLAHHKNFREVSVSRSDLKNLPAGCIIVWNKTGDLSRMSGKDGHVTVTLGDGKEASDNVRDMLILNSAFRVFVPVGTKRINAVS